MWNQYVSYIATDNGLGYNNVDCSSKQWATAILVRPSPRHKSLSRVIGRAQGDEEGKGSEAETREE